MNKAQLVAVRMDGIADRFGPVATLAATLARTDHALPPELWHGPIKTQQRAVQVGECMADYGNYPAGMSLCEVAGINGDAGDGCPFAGTPDCTCDLPDWSAP